MCRRSDGKTGERQCSELLGDLLHTEAPLWIVPFIKPVQHSQDPIRGDLNIEIRLLPKATPELNAMDHLWRQTKRETLGSRSTESIDKSALDACQYIIDLSPQQRLQKAGVLSGNFWLTT